MSFLLTLFAFQAAVWVVALSERGVKLSCFQCSWDGEKERSDSSRAQQDAVAEPVRSPLYGTETFKELPSKAQLFSHCDNCTKTDGACARWAFYTASQVRNVTWLCVNSVERGCFVEKMANQLRKEVCLCADQHHCNHTQRCTVVHFVLLSLLVAAHRLL